MKNLNIILIASSVLFIGCATQPKLESSKQYKRGFIQFNSPSSGYWMQKELKSKMLFMKKGLIKGESYVADVTAYALPVNLSDKQYKKMLKDKILISNKERFKLLKSNFNDYKLSGNTCIDSNILIKDIEASISRFDKRILLLNIISRNCKHLNKNIGYSISYSYRGKVIPKEFNQEAITFLNGMKIIGKDIK